MANQGARRVFQILGHVGGATRKPASVVAFQQTAQMIRPVSTEAQKVLDTRRQVNILDSHISYLDTGTPADENVVIFLHGNPTQAYLWRNIIPHVQPLARCLAPDLIGMGYSGKEPNNSYHFRDHYRYLSHWLDSMKLPEKVNFVLHDWGSALAFHWCHQHPDRVQSITFMESVVGPVKNWESFPEISRKAFQNMRSPAGEKMVLEKNFFVEKLLPFAIIRKLTNEETEEYRRPYLQPGESRRPTLTWPREIPIMTDGPKDVVEIVMAYHKWLQESHTIPKLYIDAKPGFFAPFIKKAVRDWPNMRTVPADGLHFLQEDSPDTIGKAINDFLQKDVLNK